MALPRGVLKGGPACGLTLAPASRAAFVWVQKAGRQARGYTKPKPGRLLYRSLGRRGDAEVFLYAGHTHRHCPSCGGYTEVGEGERGSRCEGCDTPFEAEAAAR